MKKIPSFAAIIISTILLLILCILLSQTKKQQEPHSNTEYNVQQSTQNAEKLQDMTRKKHRKKYLSTVKDSISVIAIADATIYSIYTYEQPDIFTSYLVIAKFFSKDGTFVIKNCDDLDIGYKELTISTELKELLKKQVDITVQNSIKSISNIK